MKRLSALFMIAVLSFTIFTGCGSEKTEDEIKEPSSISLEQPLILDFVQTSRHDDTMNKFSVTYEKKPQNSLAITNAMIEMMLSLGLENEMAGTAYAENNILDSLKESYDKVPVMSETYPSKEQILANNVDFIIGWGGDFNDKGVGNIDWLNEKGIKVYIPRAVESDATIESIYEDFSNLGKIFGVSDKSDEINAEIKQKFDEISQKTAGNIQINRITFNVDNYTPDSTCGLY